MSRFRLLSSTCLLALSALVALPASAVPTVITYAGFLTDNGVPRDGVVELDIELFDSATGGVPLFAEAFPGLVVPDGDLVVEIGSNTPFDPTLLDADELWVEVTVDGQVLSPRARLASVPYALRAANAETLDGLTAADIQDQITALQAQLTTLQTQLNGLASAGGAPVAFANVTGLAFASPLQLSAGTATIATNSVTATHLAAGSVGTSEVVDGSITRADVAAAEQRAVFVRAAGCGLTDQLFTSDPGACSTVSCSGFPCQSAPCFLNCNGICSDAAAATSCPAVTAGYLFSN